MKLNFKQKGRTQPDPYVFEDNGKFYMYVTAYDGVEAYSADDLFGEWNFEGIVCSVDGRKDYWAPCIIKYENKFYLYFSCEALDRPKSDDCLQFLHVAVSENPLGPFVNSKMLYERFSIDAHVVETSDGLFLFYAEDDTTAERVGTRIYVDKLIDPYTPANLRVEAVSPSFDEEIFMRNRFGDGKDWHTIEGPFWFEEKGYQYLMYSGGCYQNDTYHIGYASAKSTDADLTKVEFKKAVRCRKFCPVIIKNEIEEGTGHHSVINYKGEWYAVYHGRDIKTEENAEYVEERTARICRLEVKGGKIKAER